MVGEQWWGAVVGSSSGGEAVVGSSGVEQWWGAVVGSSGVVVVEQWWATVVVSSGGEQWVEGSGEKQW